MALCLRIEQDLDVGCDCCILSFFHFNVESLNKRDHYSCSPQYPLVIDIVPFCTNLHKISHVLYLKIFFHLYFENEIVG